MDGPPPRDYDRGGLAFYEVEGPEQRHHHVARLREAGIDVEQAIARDQLDVAAGAHGMVAARQTGRGARLAVDIMRTHPVVIVGGILQQNPFFVPPDQFLLEIRERRSGRKSVSMAG